MASASIEHVTKRFPGGEIAINDLSLEIRNGEFLVLVGPSGCGKSTALRMLAGVEDVSEGVIKIDGRVVNDVPERKRDVAMVFQTYALYPHLSAFENIAFGMRLHGMAQEDIEACVGRAAEILELGPFLHRKPRQLSGGQQQRVAVARAIVRDPQVFLFDEPLSSIDAKLREQMRVELRKIHRTLRSTFIYVTHDQVEAMALGDRIAVMEAGVLQQVGTPREVYDHPANLFVAGFIGSPAMNFIPVSVSGRTAKARALELELPYGPDLDEAILGIRPEALSQRVSAGGAMIDMEVDLAENVGRDQFVHGLIGGDAIVARIDPNVKVTQGERVRLAVDTRLVHLFDPKTGLSVL